MYGPDCRGTGQPTVAEKPARLSQSAQDRAGREALRRHVRERERAAAKPKPKPAAAVPVVLEFYGTLSGRPPLARATATARLTPSLVIVESWGPIEQLHETRRIGGGHELRFYRDTFTGFPRRFGGGGWRLVSVDGRDPKGGPVK